MHWDCIAWCWFWACIITGLFIILTVWPLTLELTLTFTIVCGTLPRIYLSCLFHISPANYIYLIMYTWVVFGNLTFDHRSNIELKLFLWQLHCQIHIIQSNSILYIYKPRQEARCHIYCVTSLMDRRTDFSFTTLMSGLCLRIGTV